jgi:hypothetical protein
VGCAEGADYGGLRGVILCCCWWDGDEEGVGAEG